MNKKLIHTLLVVVAFSSVMPVMAQTTFSPKLEKKFETRIEKAFKKGRDSYGAFHAKDKYNERKNFRNYLKQKGFFTIEISYDVIFIEDSLMPDYICRKHTSIPYKDFTKNCYFHYRDLNESYLAFTGVKYRHHDISWSGNVVNGNIDGKGIGFFRIYDSFYLLRNGEFHHGFPITDVDVIRLKYEFHSYIHEESKNFKMDKVKDSDNIYDSNVIFKGLYGSDALTQQAAIAYCKDYYAGKAENERSELDEYIYNNIKSTLEVDFYAGAFPNGRHIKEVAQWIPNNYAGFRTYKLNTIDQAIDLAQTYIKEKMNGGSNIFDMETTKPSSSNLSKIKNENERLLKRAEYFARDIEENLANDKKAQDKVQSFYDYMDILNGFYAVSNSFDVSSCIGEDFWEQIINPNPKNTYTLTSKGRKVKSSFEKAGKTILKRIDEDYFEEYDFLLQTYEYIYNYYNSFIEAVNGQLLLKNNKHVSGKLSNSSFKQYKFEDGQLVITLQNGDIYRFRQSDGKWKYYSGNTDRVFPSAVGYNSIEEAIAESEKMNKDYWNRGK